MITGSPQPKHKLFYVCLNVYPDGKEGGRKTKWIPTGLPERGNKRKAEEVTNLLKPLFNRDGSLVEKYQGLNDPSAKIAYDVPGLPEAALDAIREMYGEIKAEINPALRKAILQVDEAEFADRESPESIRNMLFCDYLILYLERIAPTIAKNTYGSYKDKVHGRIFEHFHDLGVTVGEVQPGHIEAFYRKLSNRFDLEQNSILHYHAIIRKSLQQLYIRQTILSNPADLITNRPERQDYQADFFDEEQINEYLRIVKGTKMELPVLFASLYGLRRSEALGIKDNAINFRNHQLLIRHTVTVATIDNKLIEIRENRTKSRFSLRSMPLVDTVETAILEAMERQKHYEKTLGSAYNKEDRHYLCLDEQGNLLKPGYISRKHSEILEANHFPHIRFHDLRHSCATMLLAKGVSLDKIKEWLGHSDIAMTMRYAHLNVSAAKHEMADIMSNLIKVS